jgi:hypothetical protein
MNKGRELLPQEVLADLLEDELFPDPADLARRIIERLEDAGFRIFDAPNAATMVLGIAHRSADDRMWNAFANAVLRIPPDMVPAATAALTQIAEGRTA